MHPRVEGNVKNDERDPEKRAVAAVNCIPGYLYYLVVVLVPFQLTFFLTTHGTWHAAWRLDRPRRALFSTEMITVWLGLGAEQYAAAD